MSVKLKHQKKFGFKSLVGIQKSVGCNFDVAFPKRETEKKAFTLLALWKHYICFVKGSINAAAQQAFHTFDMWSDVSSLCK